MLTLDESVLTTLPFNLQTEARAIQQRNRAVRGPPLTMPSATAAAAAAAAAAAGGGAGGEPAAHQLSAARLFSGISSEMYLRDRDGGSDRERAPWYRDTRIDDLDPDAFQDGVPFDFPEGNGRLIINMRSFRNALLSDYASFVAENDAALPPEFLQRIRESMTQNGDPFYRDTRGGASFTATEGGDKSLDKDGIVSLVRLLFRADGFGKGQLQRILYFVCDNQEFRKFLLQVLVLIVEDPMKFDPTLYVDAQYLGFDPSNPEEKKRRLYHVDMNMVSRRALDILLQLVKRAHVCREAICCTLVRHALQKKEVAKKESATAGPLAESVGQETVDSNLASDAMQTTKPEEQSKSELKGLAVDTVDTSSDDDYEILEESLLSRLIKYVASRLCRKTTFELDPALSLLATSLSYLKFSESRKASRPN